MVMEKMGGNENGRVNCVNSTSLIPFRVNIRLSPCGYTNYGFGP